jgi:hypothetical protein
MKIKIYQICITVLLCSNNSYAQFYYNTYDIIHNTKYVRQNQKVHSIQSVYKKDDKLVVNFIATLDRKAKRKPHHIVLALDSVIAYYKKDLYFYYQLDSIKAAQYKVKSIERRYSNISGRTAAGIDINCYKEMVKEGFYNDTTALANMETMLIVKDQDAELFEVSKKDRVYLQGKHIVLLYNFKEFVSIDGVDVGYVVINVENSTKIKKSRYWKLPFTFILDTIQFPFVLMMSGMQK